MGKIVGIDLGTTNSVVAFFEGGEPRVISNEEGARTTPSVVGFSESGDVVVGDMARRQAVMNPETTIYSVKRFMGRRLDEVEDEAKKVTYGVVEATNGDAHIRVGTQTFSPPEISARILQKLKRAAEKHLGEPVTDAVITVPAYFNDAQRKATRDAGEIAGLNVQRIINEPTAAALSYGLGMDKEELIAVFDFGGGTFDISILEVSGDVVEVISTNGDAHLGGDNIDEILVAWLIETFNADTGLDVSQDKMVLQRLREAAEKAKKELSSVLETEVNLPFLTADATGPKHLNVKLTRAAFDQMIAPIVSRTLAPCREALKDAGKEASDIEKVVLVGGSTRIPQVQDRVGDFFKQTPSQGVNPDEVVALGAAVQGAVLGGDITDMLLLDVTPLSLGIETKGGVTATLIERNTTIPTKRSKIFTTASDNQSTVEVHVVQGERHFVKDNRSLGKFELGDIPPAPRATPQIEVTFNVDANGIVTVSALEKKSGHEATITINDAGGLSDDEVARAVQEAEAVADAELLKKKQIELKNKMQTMVHSLRRGVIEHDEAEELAETVQELATEVDGTDFDALEPQGEEALALLGRLAEALRALRELANQNEETETEGTTDPTSNEDASSEGESSEDGDAEDADEEPNDDAEAGEG